MADLRVIDAGGPEKEERVRQRDREWSKDEFSWAIRETAANMAPDHPWRGQTERIARSDEETIDSAIKFQALHNHWPEISSSLEIEDEHQTQLERAHHGELDQSTVDRWWNDGTFEEMMAEHSICCGAFQKVASHLVNQRTQQLSGERELHDGIGSWIKIRDARIQKERQAMLANRSAAKKRKPRKARKEVAL